MTSGGAMGLKVTEIGGRGRGLVSTQPLTAGQIVLRDSPLLLYSALPFSQQQQQAQSTYCDHCFKTLSSSSSSSSSSCSSQQQQSCPWCSQHHFCSSNCMTVALSSSHTQWVCGSLSRLRESISAFDNHPSELQVQARFLISAYNLIVVSPTQFQSLLSLQGNETLPSEAGSARFLHSLFSSLLPPPGKTVSFSLELIGILLTKDKLNAFGLMAPFSADIVNRSVRAYGLYPMASFFNHDCLPNGCRFDYVDSTENCNTDIIVRMIHDVPQGREICLSYFPVNFDYPTRQKRLLEDYGFSCDCDRCKVESNWSDTENVDENDEEMDEDDDEAMVGSDDEQGETGDGSDFPHAYFFMKYMCNQENCGGTLAPLPPSDDNAVPSNVLECNVCGNLKHEDDDGEENLSMDD